MALFEKCSRISGRFWRLFAAGLLVLPLSLAVVGLLCGRQEHKLDTREGRIAYVRSFGWEVEEGSEQMQEIALPENFDRVLQSYNLLQLSQGYDLRSAAGKRCRQYVYTLKSYPGYDGRVLAVLYVFNGRVIGGDIHTADAEGFLHALRK